MLRITNGILEITVQKKGAELRSIRSIKSDQEFIWEGIATIWGSFSPVLFPIIGALKDNKYTFDEQSYSLPKHGFIRNNENLNCYTKDLHTIRCELDYSNETLKQYPFKFRFAIEFKLENTSIIVSHFIENLDFNNKMYFSIGGHPAFKCPFNEHENYEDYFLEFEGHETSDRWLVSKDGLIEASTLPFLNEQKELNLTHDLFKDDALIFKDLKSKSIRLKSKKSTSQIKIAFSDFEYLGIWAKPNGNFVCIEPWNGISDSVESNGDFRLKEGIIKLEPRQKYSATYTIEINE